MTQNTISNDFLVVHLCMSAHMTGNHRCPVLGERSGPKNLVVRKGIRII